jgi:death-on-curing protein
MAPNDASDVQYLDIPDLLSIAESVLNIEAEALLEVVDVPVAELALHAPAAMSCGVEFYPELGTKAAILCTRLVQFRPLPEGGKRVAYLSVIEFLERNGRQMACASIADVVTTMSAIEAGTITLTELEAWIKRQMR